MPLMVPVRSESLPGDRLVPLLGARLSSVESDVICQFRLLVTRSRRIHHRGGYAQAAGAVPARKRGIGVVGMTVDCQGSG